MIHQEILLHHGAVSRVIVEVRPEEDTGRRARFLAKAAENTHGIVDGKLRKRRFLSTIATFEDAVGAARPLDVDAIAGTDLRALPAHDTLLAFEIVNAPVPRWNEVTLTRVLNGTRVLLVEDEILQRDAHADADGLHHSEDI